MAKLEIGTKLYQVSRRTLELVEGMVNSVTYSGNHTGYDLLVNRNGSNSVESITNIDIKGLEDNEPYDYFQWFQTTEEAIEDYERGLDGDSSRLIYDKIWEEDVVFE